MIILSVSGVLWPCAASDMAFKIAGGAPSLYAAMTRLWFPVSSAVEFGLPTTDFASTTSGGSFAGSFHLGGRASRIRPPSSSDAATCNSLPSAFVELPFHPDQSLKSAC